jgi:hypothetical protein
MISNERRTLIRLLFFTLVAAVMGIGCSLPEKPGDWSWDTHLTVPLGIRTYGMWDLENSYQHVHDHGSGIGMNADSSMYFATYNKLQARYLDSLYLDPAEYDVTKPITAVLVPLNLQQTDSFTLGRLNPDIAALHGTVQDLPSHHLQSTADFVLSADIDSFVVDTGTIFITVSNTLPYDVSDLRLSLINGRGMRYTLLENEGLAAGGQISRNVSLSQAHITQQDSIEVSATGAGGTAIPVDSTRGLVVAAQIGTIQAAPYYGVIPSQFFYEDSTYALAERHRLYLGVIDDGMVSISAINGTQVDDTLTIVFPTIITPLGDSLVSRQVVPAGETRTDSVDLHGYRMRLPNETPQPVQIRIYTSSHASHGHRTFLPGVEFVSGAVTMSRISFTYFQGEVDHLALQFPQENTHVEQLPEGWNGVHPTSVDAYVHVISELSASATSSADVHTFLSGSAIASRHFEVPEITLNSDTTIVFNGLADLLAEYPDSMTSAGQMTMSGFVTIHEFDTLGLTIELRAPISFTMSPVHAPGSVLRVETTDIEDIQSATARVRMWNRLPVGGFAYVIADRDSLNLLPGSGADVDTLVASSLPVSAIENGRATGEAYTEVTVEISEHLLDFLRHPPFFTRLDLTLPGSNGDTLIAHGSDYVKVQVIGDVIYRMHTGDAP